MEEFDNGFFGFDDAQKFAAQAAEQTPQQLGQTLKDAGVDLGDYGPRKQENLYDLNAGAMMGGPQQPDIYSQQQAAAQGQSMLQQRPDGAYQAVYAPKWTEGGGGVRRYDPKIIMQLGDAGQLSPLSDQGQMYERLKAQQQAQQPQGLEATLQQIQLKPWEMNQLAQYDRGFAEVERKLLSKQYTPQEADAYRRQLEAGSEHLRQRQAMQVRLSIAISEQQQMQEAARLKMMQVQNQKIDAETFFKERVRPDPVTGERGYLNSKGDWVPLTGTKGSAADPNRPGGPNDTFNKVYTEVYNYLKIPAKDGEQPKPPTKEQIIEEMQKRGAVRDALEGKTQPQQGTNVAEQFDQWAKKQGEAVDEMFAKPPRDMADAKAEAVSWAKKYGNVSNQNIPENVRKRLELLQKYISGGAR